MSGRYSMDRVDEIVLMCWFWFSFFFCLFFVFVSFFLSLPLSLSFCLFLSLFLLLSFSFSFFRSFSLSLSFPSFFSFSFPPSPSLLPPFLSSLSFPLSLSFFCSVFLFFSLFSLFLSLSLVSRLCLFLSVFLFLSVCSLPFPPLSSCLSLSVSLCLSVCLSVCLSLFRPFVWFRGNVVMPFNTCARFHLFWRVNGSTVTWVDANLASDSSTVRNQIREVQQVDRVNGIYGSSSWRCPETFYVRDFQRHVPDQDPQEWHHGIFRLVGFTLRQLFDTTTSEEKYMNQQGQHEGPRRRMWEEQFHGPSKMARGYFDRWHSSGRWIAFAALHPHYLIAFDLVNSSCTPWADGSAITGVSAVTFLHFHISTSPGRLGLQQFQALHYISTTSLRLILWIVFALHPYYFTDSSAVQDQLRGVWHIWELHCASSFFMEFGQHLFTSFQNYMGQQGQQDSPRRRMWEEHQFHGLLPAI